MNRNSKANSSILVLTKKKSKVYSLMCDIETQELITKIFYDAAEKIMKFQFKEFNPQYKLEEDEIFVIRNFNMPSEIINSIENQANLDFVDSSFFIQLNEKNIEKKQINALIVGEYNKENTKIVFQNFTKSQIFNTEKINLFFDKNTFLHQKNPGISINNSVDCIYDGKDLYFISFSKAKQIFDLTEYYREATEEDFNNFINAKIFKIDNEDKFIKCINDTMRKEIAYINDSNVLKSFSAVELKKKAKILNIELKVKDEKIVINEKKEEIKILLDFLNDNAYKSAFTDDIYVSNSKTKFMPKK